ncbi:tetratricopeptide repeat-containing protein [Vibrio parahaemolyticus]|uniref:type III secretion system chaperone VscY n=1 Tax=Vibrio parahaemolyticus TaxID=670 RepID=UPI0009924DDB|nr:type III secretion system chaperone VscY [Vibrio parahaemolyticus]MEA5291811.1 type III secretion system chaperone VscY [Vibrio parahaemolyticus]OOQ70477.1 translocation protein Y [Vibrio parahaemolyticus]PLR55867.1 tetratricopeptide repeat-containing protein [Vibrio parahaemolyticus]PMT74720.1 tetratricopeptide repeat-containing protein [Vibrio parahaemolyticus]PMT80137.1 tetratricopeptide repeat-containing protein [Vibrio parahaemolyticus]
MLSTKDIELLLVHAALQVQYQQPDQAIAILDAVLELEPEREDALHTLAVACLQTGRYTRAVAVCEGLLKSQSQSVQAAGLWFCLSQARWKQNDVEGARQAHRRYLQSLHSESHE